MLCSFTRKQLLLVKKLSQLIKAKKMHPFTSHLLQKLNLLRFNAIWIKCFFFFLMTNIIIVNLCVPSFCFLFGYNKWNQSYSSLKPFLRDEIIFLVFFFSKKVFTMSLNCHKWIEQLRRKENDTSFYSAFVSEIELA